jgi:hypothetical protein
MTHGFDREAKAFIAGWDRLELRTKQNFADLLDKSAVRVLIPQAEWLACQRTNPLMEFTLRQLCVLDVADSFLRWLPDPTAPARWSAMFETREELRGFRDVEGE